MARISILSIAFLFACMACLAFAAPQASSLESAATHLNKRLSCTKDSQCVGTHHFCSRKSSTCIKKFAKSHKCTHDDNCLTGYCGRHTDKCADKKADGKTCYGTNSACSSGYCGIYSNKCEKQVSAGKTCSATAQCKGDYVCKDKKCVKSSSPTSTGTTKRNQLEEDDEE